MEAPVCIPANIRKIHIAGENLGLYVAGPVCILGALKTKGLLSIALFTVGIGTMAVDAWLLRKAQK